MCFPFDFRRLRRAYPLIPFNFPFKSLKSLYPLDFAENLLYPYNRTPPLHPPGGPTRTHKITGNLKDISPMVRRSDVALECPQLHQR